MLVVVVTITGSCGVGDQVEQMKALKDCVFSIESADSLYIANMNVAKLVSSGGIDLASTPALAFAMLQRHVPLKGRVMMKIINPGDEKAGISSLEYQIAIKDAVLAEGTIDQPVEVEPDGGVALVPVRIDRDLYPLLSNAAYQDAVASFLSAKEERTAIVTLRVKPAIEVASKKISYPGYIDINKEISNKQLKGLLAQPRTSGR